MDKPDMFQARFGEIDKFGWWDLEIIPADADIQFASMGFQDICQTCGVWFTLAAPEHQEMNRQVKVIWRTLHTIEHSLMVHVQFLEAYIHFALMYTTDHILQVQPIKYLINEDGESTIPFIIATGKKSSISNLIIHNLQRV